MGAVIYDRDCPPLGCVRGLSAPLPAPQKTGIAKEAGGASDLVRGVREVLGPEGEVPSPLWDVGFSGFVRTGSYTGRRDFFCCSFQDPPWYTDPFFLRVTSDLTFSDPF